MNLRISSRCIPRRKLTLHVFHAVKLLDEGDGIDPLEKYDFGKSASYLFRPCENEDGTPDEECDISYLGDQPELQLSADEQDILSQIQRVPNKETVSSS